MNEMMLNIMASIGLIACTVVMCGAAIWFVEWRSKEDTAGVRELPRCLGVAKRGDVVILEFRGVMSAEMRTSILDSLNAMNTGVNFILLSDGIRVARVEPNGS
jgi:hypothetical protein